MKHIVFLSVQGTDKVSFIPHAKIEKLILKSHIPYTFIRPSYFMQNLTTTILEDIKENDCIFLPNDFKLLTGDEPNTLDGFISKNLTH